MMDGRGLSGGGRALEEEEGSKFGFSLEGAHYWLLHNAHAHDDGRTSAGGRGQEVGLGDFRARARLTKLTKNNSLPPPLPSIFRHHLSFWLIPATRTTRCSPPPPPPHSNT